MWEQRRALGRRLASLRSRSGFSQWEFAPLTGYSRSTLSDAELGRHRLRREFWERCDEALMADGVLTAAYDRIEAVAMAVRRTARSQAQAAREELASRRLQALLPAPSAGGLGAGSVGAEGAGAIGPVSFPVVPVGSAPVGPDAFGPVVAGPAPVGVALGTDTGVVPGAPPDVVPDEDVPGEAPGGTATNGVVWGGAVPAGLAGPAAAGAVPPAARTAPGGPAPAGPATPHVAATGPEIAAQSLGEAAQSTLTVMEQCPHCHQPVTVIIVAAAPSAAGGSGG